jgi:signal transduction histidine kinase
MAGAPGWASLAACVVAGLGLVSYRVRRGETEKLRRLRSELCIYRVGEAMAQAGREEALVQGALDAIAEGTGIPRWALYARGNGADTLAVVATRGLPEGATAELAPDPIGPNARSAASRAAWLGETVVARGEESPPPSEFDARVEGLEPGSTIVSVPLPERGEDAGVLQGFLPRGSAVGPEDLALLRWMAAQLGTGLKRLRLERRDQLLASYMMSTGEILLGLDPQGTITHANDAAERAMRTSPGGLAGTPLDRIAVLDDTAALAATDLDGSPQGASVFDATRSTGDFSGAIWFLRADGIRFPAEVRLSSTLDREGRVAGLVLVGHDDSQRRAHERELEARTRELASLNQRLEDANRDLTRAQRLQNDFLANTSHELRTPLNAVIGFATLIEQGAEATREEGRDFARSIRESAEHLLGVINDLLDLAKVQAGRFQLRLQAGDVRPAVRAAADAVGPVAARKGIRLRVDLVEEALIAAIDPSRLQQVMLNVLGNAVKFTDRGEVRVRGWRDAETEEARILVEDTGVGIDPERQALLFTKFGQADTSYHRRHAGAGLGLAITRALVGNMGGTISVESEGIGRGTRVTIALPPAIGTLAGRGA